MRKWKIFDIVILLLLAIVLVGFGLPQIEVPPFILYPCAAYLGGLAIIWLIKKAILFIMRKILSAEKKD